MTSSGAASVYRIFKKTEGAASVRSVVIAMIIIAAVLTGVGVVRVTRQHEVLALGYQLDRESEHLRELKEIQRRLMVEYATQSSPDRIRRLATELGMTPVAPDKIRIIDMPAAKKVAAQ